MSTSTWIVITVVAAVLLIVAVVTAIYRTRSRRHRQAEEIREQARLESANVDRREALAHETAARARAAQAEAEVKAAEAARLQERAAEHQSEASASREQLQQRWDHADKIDPKSGKQRRDGTDTDEITDDTVWSREHADPATHPEDVRH
ncbi:hypothetical protein [Mycobacterium shigaense]|uniref:Uncharacterized protein n=1 Tax=Mycobacterium shigaense TaxID=722731 RepID=A0A1Z4ENU2_9MYCO|nr:hypothetical protein [Mycobacterium shigaense]MEA1122719.1 hypothetical protein [Mycobacterium shigaense]PRI14878.1 hypothetical protein B2J96_10350 [Mycobacterium shigaense]BAX94674.1 hypothetical protein MSG_04559 [Mycobacterium shigaense]